MTKTTAFSTACALTLPPIAAQSVHDPDPVVKVMAFHHLYEVPIHPFGNPDQTFSHMDNERVALRLSLHIEEFKELLKKGFGVEVDMLFYAEGDARPTTDIKEALDQATERGIPRNGKEVMDALGDMNYVDTGMAIEMGYDPRPVMAEIHAGNMTKLGEDGKPVINDGKLDPTARVGKVLKGPNYVEPNIPAALGWEN